MEGQIKNNNPFIITVTAHEYVDDGVSGLLLQGGGVSGVLRLFAVYFYVVVPQLPRFSPLEHVVGPLRAAAPLTVDEASPASREGAPASSAVVYPGFLSITIVVLEVDTKNFKGQEENLKSLTPPPKSQPWNNLKLYLHILSIVAVFK